MYFWTYVLRKTWLGKCLKSHVSENASTSNMVNGPKHFSNLNGNTLTIFIDHCEGNSIGKSLSEWYSKYWHCLLTHWLPMTSILFLIDTIYGNLFRCNYIANKNIFWIFLRVFENLDPFLNIFKKKMTLIADVLLNFWASKNVVR